MKDDIIALLKDGNWWDVIRLADSLGEIKSTVNSHLRTLFMRDQIDRRIVQCPSKRSSARYEYRGKVN